MLPNIQMSDELMLEHRQQLQYGAEQKRLLIQTKEHHSVRMRRLLEKLSRFFAVHTSSTKQIEQRDEFNAECIEEPKRESLLQRR
jgi:hypothetical protein